MVFIMLLCLNIRVSSVKEMCPAYERNIIFLRHRKEREMSYCSKIKCQISTCLSLQMIIKSLAGSHFLHQDIHQSISTDSLLELCSLFLWQITKHQNTLASKKYDLQTPAK